METYLPPNRQLSLKAIALPHNHNVSKEAYNGWVLSQMHQAGCNIAACKTSSDVKVLSVNDLVFYEPILDGDEVSYYAEIIHKNHHSLTLHIEAWAHRASQPNDIKITDGSFIFVVNDNKPN